MITPDSIQEKINEKSHKEKISLSIDEKILGDFKEILTEANNGQPANISRAVEIIIETFVEENIKLAGK